MNGNGGEEEVEETMQGILDTLQTPPPLLAPAVAKALARSTPTRNPPLPKSKVAPQMKEWETTVMGSGMEPVGQFGGKVSIETDVITMDPHGLIKKIADTRESNGVGDVITSLHGLSHALHQLTKDHRLWPVQTPPGECWQEDGLKIGDFVDLFYDDVWYFRGTLREMAEPDSGGETMFRVDFNPGSDPGCSNGVGEWWPYSQLRLSLPRFKKTESGAKKTAENELDESRRQLGMTLSLHHQTAGAGTYIMYLTESWHTDNNTVWGMERAKKEMRVMEKQGDEKPSWLPSVGCILFTDVGKSAFAVQAMGTDWTPHKPDIFLWVPFLAVVDYSVDKFTEKYSLVNLLTRGGRGRNAQRTAVAAAPILRKTRTRNKHGSVSDTVAGSLSTTSSTPSAPSTPLSSAPNTPIKIPSKKEMAKEDAKGRRDTKRVQAALEKANLAASSVLNKVLHTSSAPPKPTARGGLLVTAGGGSIPVDTVALEAAVHGLRQTMEELEGGLDGAKASIVGFTEELKANVEGIKVELKATVEGVKVELKRVIAIEMAKYKNNLGPSMQEIKVHTSFPPLSHPIRPFRIALS